MRSLEPDILATRMGSRYCMGSCWSTGIVCESDVNAPAGVCTCSGTGIFSPVCAFGLK